MVSFVASHSVYSVTIGSRKRKQIALPLSFKALTKYLNKFDGLWFYLPNGGILPPHGSGSDPARLTGEPERRQIAERLGVTISKEFQGGREKYF